MASDCEARARKAAIKWQKETVAKGKFSLPIVDIFKAGARWAYEEGRKAGLEEALLAIWPKETIPTKAAEYYFHKVHALLDKKPGKGGECP